MFSLPIASSILGACTGEAFLLSILRVFPVTVVRTLSRYRILIGGTVSRMESKDYPIFRRTFVASLVRM